jgi:hypothetical protein
VLYLFNPKRSNISIMSNTNIETTPTCINRFNRGYIKQSEKPSGLCLGSFV